MSKRKLSWTLSVAISTLVKVEKLGFDGLRIFGIITEPYENIQSYLEDETMDEIEERLSSPCWTGMDYFKMWLQDSCVDIVPDMENNKIFDLDQITLTIPGVYYVEFAGNEAHLYIWIIKGDSIWYAATYGGVCSITVKEFNRVEYHKRFIKAMKGSLEDYAYIFQVEPEVREVNFKWIAIVKSPRYNLNI